MASAPSDPRPLMGRVDFGGRLIEADPELERLQVEAGSRLGASLALPQLAAVVRVARRLGIPLSRRVLAAGRDQDLDMWVRAVPDSDDVLLTIDRWTARPASPPRLAIASVEHESLEACPMRWSVDEQLRIVSLAPALAQALAVPSGFAGEPLTRLFRLREDDDGSMPLLDALASRTSFAGQRATARKDGGEFVLSADVVLGSNGVFAGFEGSAASESEPDPGGPARPLIDSCIHTALRSPLDSIVRSAQEMMERSGGDVREEYSAYAADIAAAARHLLSVIRSLAEQSEPGASHVDLAELVEEAVALLESAADERGITIAVEPLERCPARGESRSVIQILVNLIGNAVRYTSEGTTVTISFEHSGDAVMLHVADDGPGIDPADHERVFEAFQQGGDPRGEGSGLGLAIARRLARAMGGDILLESVPGRGARFTLVLAAD